MSNRVSVFIDVGNQFHCISKRWPGQKLDYKKYLDLAKTFGQIDRSFAYGTQIEDTAVKFITALSHLGYETRYKQVEKNVWYSWCAGMSMDIVRLVTNDKVDTVVIGNSDRCMTSVITWAKERGVRVIIIGCGINKELKDLCDKWVEINAGMLEQKETADEVTEAAE